MLLMSNKILTVCVDIVILNVERYNSNLKLRIN